MSDHLENKTQSKQPHVPSKRKRGITQPKVSQKKKQQTTDFIPLDGHPHSQPKTFQNLLDEIRRRAKSEREKGELFERAIRNFLRQSPEHDFEGVWMRKDYPDLAKIKLKKKDLGIDLIAKERKTGDLWAIQCKCYDEKNSVNKSDIDSFFTESGKKPFKTRLIVTTTDNWGSHAEDALNNQTKQCITLGLAELSEKPFEWTLTSIKRDKKKKETT